VWLCEAQEPPPRPPYCCPYPCPYCTLPLLTTAKPSPLFHQDPHFRKAAFDPARCPPDCPRPCEPGPPAPCHASPPPRARWGPAVGEVGAAGDALSRPPSPAAAACPVAAVSRAGVDTARCYGCGRCVPVCPLGLVEAASFVRTPEEARARARARADRPAPTAPRRPPRARLRRERRAGSGARC
jgi:ferredoxin